MASVSDFLISSSSAFFFAMLVEDVRVRGLEERIVAVFKGAQVFYFDIVEQAVDAGVQDGYLLFDAGAAGTAAA